MERAEINPKKRMSTNTYDSSADVFKLDLVYKDRNGAEHELKWLIKVTRYIKANLLGFSINLVSLQKFCLHSKMNSSVEINRQGWLVIEVDPM